MGLFKKNKTNRVCVIGLDGVPCTMLQDLADQGVMPRFKELIDSGYLSNILITCDVCLKTLLHAYGGWGYDHVLTYILPMLKDEGVTDEQIDQLIRENPKRFLNIDNA